MLTKELSEAKILKGGIRPVWIAKTEPQYRQYAEELVALYRNGIGRRRHQLKTAAEQVLAREPNCSQRRLGGLIKLLEDAGEWT